MAARCWWGDWQEDLPPELKPTLTLARDARVENPASQTWTAKKKNRCFRAVPRGD